MKKIISKFFFLSFLIGIFSIGNVAKEPLGDILERGMKNKWLGPYRDECIIGENFDFIKFHNDSVAKHLKDTPYLPVPYEKGFALNGSV